MAEFDIGSLAVMEHGDLVGMLTFREVIHTLAKNGGSVGNHRAQRDGRPQPAELHARTELDEVRPHDARAPHPLHAGDGQQAC
jgi:hypothetical protein